MAFIDISGHKYGRLTVISRVENAPTGQSQWRCRCDCGVELVVKSNALRTGNTRSCGCLMRDTAAGQHTIHGLSKHPAYLSWKAAKVRCTNPNQKMWEHYGGRGIEFRLPPFQEFWEVMRDTWFDGATLDRYPDVDGHYELGNVRWATRSEQMGNRRSSVLITFQGVTKTQAEWARELGINHSNLAYRIEKWGVEEALTRPINERKRNVRNAGNKSRSD